MRVFARKGYQNAVVEEVADEAGVSKGTIYTYFDRKEELLGAVFDGLMEEMRARESAILDSDLPPLEKIRGMLQAFLEISGREEYARVMLDIWLAGMREPERFGIDFAGLYVEYRALFRDLLQEAQEGGEVPDHLSSVAPFVLIGAAEGVLIQWLLDPESLNISERADDIVDLLYDGIHSRNAF